MNRDQGGHTFSFHKLASNDVARALGGYQNHIDIGGWHYRFVVDGEAVREKKRFSLGQIRSNIRVIDIGLFGVRQGNEYDIRL